MSKVDAQMGGTPGELDDSAHGSKFPGPKADLEGKPQDLLQEPEYVGKSTWYHIGFHVTAAVASVPTLGLPFAVSLMGWPGGLIALLCGGCVTLFTAFLIASLEEYGGKRHIRFRDLSEAIFGRVGWWIVAPFQMAICFGSVVANHIVAGQAMKAINRLAWGAEPTVTLTQYIIVFGAFNLIIAQVPHFHALRFVNAVATFSTISFSFIAVVVSIYDGTHGLQGAPPDYSTASDPQTLLWDIFTGLGIMAFAYGNTVLPEIGACAMKPTALTMKRGICMGYVTIIGAYICVSISGYWAFGNGVGAIVLQSLTYPNWAVMLAWAFGLTQLVGTTQTYCQPIYEICDKQLGNIFRPVWTFRNTAVRLICRSIFICFCALIAAMVPFFGDMMGIIGALGYTPMDFVLPQFLWIKAYNIKGWKRTVALLIAFIYMIVGVMALIGGVRQIVLDSSTYSLFANLD